MSSREGKRPWWVGRASNPVGGAMRRRVGSTPIPFRLLTAPGPGRGRTADRGYAEIEGCAEAGERRGVR